MGDVMKKTNPDSFFVAYTCYIGYDGRLENTTDFGSGVDAYSTVSVQPGKVINIFGPEPVYYGRKITVLQVQRIRGVELEGSVEYGEWIAEVIYRDDSKPGSYNLPDAEQDSGSVYKELL